jgi:hypothetical protein
MRKYLLLMIAFSLLAAACSGSVEFSIGGESPDNAAEDLIEGDIAEQAGLGELTADCEKPEDPEVGTFFDCTAETEDGQTILLTTEIDREDHIDVNSTNLITPQALPSFETAGTNALAEQFGVELPDGTIQCGDESVVLAADGTFVCSFEDPGNGDIYDITYEVTDIDAGDFNLAIAETPRS